MLKLFNNIITCILYVMRVFCSVRSLKEPSGFLIFCFHVPVAERITFDVYVGIAYMASSLPQTLVIVFYSLFKVVIILFHSNRSQRISLGLAVVT